MLKSTDVRAREEKSSLYFADDDGGTGDPFESIELTTTASNSNNGRINTQELLLLEDNSKFVQEREKEINVIVKSIVELNTIFKDLAQMVTEQVRPRPLAESFSARNSVSKTGFHLL